MATLGGTMPSEEVGDVSSVQDMADQRWHNAIIPRMHSHVSACILQRCTRCAPAGVKSSRGAGTHL
jgi:hypothetical protein